MHGMSPDIWDEMDSLMSRLMEDRFGSWDFIDTEIPFSGQVSENTGFSQRLEKDLVEPIPEIHREPDSLRIITDLPGANPEGITLDLQPDTLVIEAESESSRYRAVADISGAPMGPMSSTFRNGVLEVTFRNTAEA